MSPGPQSTESTLLLCKGRCAVDELKARAEWGFLCLRGRVAEEKKDACVWSNPLHREHIKRTVLVGDLKLLQPSDAQRRGEGGIQCPHQQLHHRSFGGV